MAGFVLETRDTPSGKVLYFPFMAISDIHLGSSDDFCQAETLCQMLENTTSDILKLPGDVFDAEKLLQKRTWDFEPWQRQVIAHILRKAGNGTDTEYILGNHEIGLRGSIPTKKHKQFSKFGLPSELPRVRNFKDKNICGVHVTAESQYVDPAGQKFQIIHGDKGKGVVNNNFDGIICGHSHSSGLIKSRNGKRIVNCGSCTRSVQAAVHDRNGTWAIIEWQEDGIKIDKVGRKKPYKVKWEKLGINKPPAPKMTEDQYTAKTDRILRLVYRQWPPKDRVLNLKKIWQTHAHQAAHSNDNPEETPFSKRLRQKQIKEEIKIITDIPIPKPERRPQISHLQDLAL